MDLDLFRRAGRDPELLLSDVRKEKAERSLYSFLEQAWKYIDASPFVPGWPLEAVCEHLQAVVDGDIRRLIINIPPRMGKSSITSVALTAWCWTQRQKLVTSGPQTNFLYASYANRLSLRDSVKCRRLIESPWYQANWGDRFSLTGDVNTKNIFENNFKGVRQITSVDAGTTGFGGDIIVADDPNAANELSDVNLESTIEWWTGTMSTRLNNPKKGAFVVIQQRLHERDMTGFLLEQDADWTHLCLPMRYDQTRSFVTSIGWEDPRQEDGELLWPERFGEEDVRLLEKQLGPWSAAGQLQQLPRPKGGGVIDVDDWVTWESESYPPFDYIMMSLDTAYTEKQENDFSACTVWGIFSHNPNAVTSKTTTADGKTFNVKREYGEQAPRLFLMYAWQDRLTFPDLVTRIEKTAKTFKADLLVIESKASGMSVAQELQRRFSNSEFMVTTNNPGNVDKLSRLYSVQGMFKDQLIYAPDKIWATMVIEQVASFPKGKHDDLVDTVSQAVRYVRDMGLLKHGVEHRAEIDDMRRFKSGPPQPLYPV